MCIRERGHSDADVLLHAIMDALLGAAALGDIGQHFPDSDEAYKGISSLSLLKRVGEILAENGFLIENIDSTVIAQKPKLLPYRPGMMENIADALGLERDREMCIRDRRMMAAGSIVWQEAGGRPDKTGKGVLP